MLIAALKSKHDFKQYLRSKCVWIVKFFQIIFRLYQKHIFQSTFLYSLISFYFTYNTSQKIL